MMPEEKSQDLVSVPADLIVTIVSWWRGASEAPGGCSPRDAINGMGDAIWALEIARREQAPSEFEIATAKRASKRTEKVVHVSDNGWVWDWFNESPQGETYGVRRADEVLCYTNRFKAGYDEAVRIAAAMNASGEQR